MMPKKGRRTLIVDDKTYYYKIRKDYDRWDSAIGELNVIIQSPEGSVKTHKFKQQKDIPFTPRNVRELIEKEG